MVPTRPFQRAKQAVPVRRVVRLAWTVGLVPVAAMLALAMRTDRPDDWMRCDGAVDFGSRVVSCATGADRLGDHLVAFTADGRLHVLQLRGGALVDTAVATGWSGREAERVRLQFRDIDGDDRCELLACSLKFRTTAGADDRTEWPAEVYRLEADGAHRQPERIQIAYHPQRLDLRRMVVDGAEYLPEAVTNPESRPLTRLRRVDGSLLRQMLAGEATQIFDADSDGAHDLLTVEVDGSRQPWVRYRLFLHCPGGFHQVWDAWFQQFDPRRPWRRSTLLADLHGDGRPSIAIFETVLGRVSLWSVDPQRVRS